jgi:release factor glutamine methyltransferase
VKFQSKNPITLTVSSLHHLNQFIQSELAALSLPKEQRVAEANWMIEHAFGSKNTHLIAMSDHVLDPDDPRLQQIQGWLTERIEKRTPLQYCLKQAWFYGRPFWVTPDVLIPRPETELLVEWAWAKIKTRNWATVVDIGTGSGCIAISLALLAKQQQYSLNVWATDISEAALKVAKQNAQTYETDIHWIQGDGLGALPPNIKLDCIVSNPPYIAHHFMETLTPEVKNHEPHLALFANDNGLYFYQQFAQDAAQYLNPNGGLMCEIGSDMGPALKVLFNTPTWQDVQIKKDYAQHDRMLFALTCANC